MEEDVISSMPDIVVTHILDRLPIQDAVKTSVLSRNWRFKWTTLSQLVFDEMFYLYLKKTRCESKFGSIVSWLLMNVKGAITKFVLCIDERCYSYPLLYDEDIAHWIFFLSRKGVKDLTIIKTNGEPLKLPTHLFSCLDLKHLKLFHCRFDPPGSFNGFPNLLSLESGLLHFESGKFGKFITQCPSLEILNMRYWRFVPDIVNNRYVFRLHEDVGRDINTIGKVKLVEIGNLVNLKILSLSLCDTVIVTNFSSSIIELVGHLPKLQELNLDFERCKFTEVGAKKRFFTTSPYLKILKLSTIDLCNGIMSSCALELIRSFPNLQTLEIIANDVDEDPTPAIYSPDVDYNRMELQQLQSVVIKYARASESVVFFIKYLLVCSPSLTQIVVRSYWFNTPDEKLMCARKLLKLHRASPIAEIDLR